MAGPLSYSMSSDHLDITEDSDSRPFRCEYCPKVYTRADHLARHLRSHTKEKPFTCLICRKSFSRRDLLSRHASVHENGSDSSKRRKLNSGIHSRATQACVSCASSKLKCDGSTPCSRCVSKGVDCHYAQRANAFKIVEPHESQMQAPDEATEEPDVSLSGPSRSLVADNLGIMQHEFSVDADHEAPSDRFEHNHNAETQVSIQIPSPFDTLSSINEQDLSFACFLRDVMGQEIIPNDDQTILPFDTDTYAPWDLLDFSADNLIPEIAHIEQPSVHDSSHAITYAQRREPSNLASGTVTPNQGRSGLSLGIQAFRESLWNYIPSIHNHTRADQHNLSITLDATNQGYPTPTLIPTLPTLGQSQRDRILATIIAQCEASAVPQIVSSFPSAELLSSLIHEFLSSQDVEDDGFIHMPSFDLNDQNVLFLLAAIAAGAIKSDHSNIRRLGLAFQEAARTAAADTFENDNRNVRSLRALQGMAIQLDVGRWSGDRRRLEISESFTQPLVTMMRRGGFFRQSRTPEHPTEDDPPHLIEDKWRRWIEQESFNRLAFHVLIEDTQTSIALQNVPLVSVNEMTIPLPVNKELWNAKTAALWKRIYIDKHTTFANVLSARAAADDLSLLASSPHLIDVQFTTIILLCNLWALTWHTRELFKIHTNPVQPNTTVILQSLHESNLRAIEQASFHLEDLPGGMNFRSRVMLQRIKANIFVSLEDVQTLAGKAGDEEARKIYPSLKSWASGKESRHAIWHAGQILRISQAMPSGRMQGFSAVALYHASLILWAYSILSLSTGVRVGSREDSTWSNDQSASHGVAFESELQRRGDDKVVQLDGIEDITVQRFLVLGSGLPSILSYHKQNSGSARVSLTNAQETMSSIRYLLRDKGGPKGDNQSASLVSNLAKLMASLGKAANTIRASQRT